MLKKCRRVLSCMWPPRRDRHRLRFTLSRLFNFCESEQRSKNDDVDDEDGIDIADKQHQLNRSPPTRSRMGNFVAVDVALAVRLGVGVFVRTLVALIRTICIPIHFFFRWNKLRSAKTAIGVLKTGCLL